MDSLEGKSNKSMKWAGLYLNNLEESIVEVFKRGELSKLKNFNSKIVKFVEPYLKKSKEIKSGLNRYL